MKYVGKCVYGRKNDWEKYLGSGTYLKRAIAKYGKENFYRIIIDECDSEEELREVEEYYIEQFDAVKSNEFYNVKATSIGGDTFTNNPNKEHIRKLKSINASGSRNPMYGRPKTQKTIESIKKANSRPISIDGVEYPQQMKPPGFLVFEIQQYTIEWIQKIFLIILDFILNAKRLSKPSIRCGSRVGPSG